MMQLCYNKREVIDMAANIISACFLLLAVTSLFISYRAYRQRGFLFHNAYIFASADTREQMDKAPYYRQSAIIFLLSGGILALIGAGILLNGPWLIFTAIFLSIFTLTYVIRAERKMEAK